MTKIATILTLISIAVTTISLKLEIPLILSVFVEHFIPYQILLFLFSRYFERKWKLNLIFFFVFITYSNLLIVKILSSFLTVKTNGVSSYLSALLIAFKRDIPEHSIKLYKISFRTKYAPSFNILLHFILLILKISHNFYSVLIGSIIAWVYLRFYKKKGGVRGDRSEVFSFCSFFPDSWRFLLLIVVLL
jgi:hypothetical protein